VIRALLLHDANRPAQLGVDPFRKHAAELRERFGLEIEEIPVEEVEARIDRLPACDLVFFQDRQDSNKDSIARARALREIAGEPRLVFLDSYASSYARKLCLLPYVDVFVAKVLFRDRGLYQRSFRDGRIFSDAMIELYGLESRFTGRTPDLEHWDKVILGWNVGGGRFLEERFEAGAAPGGERTIDVHCRVAMLGKGRTEWFAAHRRDCVERIASLGERYRVAVSTERIPQELYDEELRRSRIVVSPFGWGEVCYRDFEAVANDCLLVKPSMEHLETVPDIYRAGETYVPVRWDLADLEETLVRWLADDEGRARIAANAREVYGLFLDGGPVERLEAILARAGFVDLSSRPE
jgi:hypothetical protein